MRRTWLGSRCRTVTVFVTDRPGMPFPPKPDKTSATFGRRLNGRHLKLLVGKQALGKDLGKSLCHAKSRLKQAECSPNNQRAAHPIILQSPLQHDPDPLRG